ncbi:MAG: cbb3-type cytochrome oxidase assembly protein CcoS [Pseudomonadota bacterium]
MEIIYLLIPLSLLLIAAAIGAFFWAVNSGQFDDLDTPPLDILQDDEHMDDSRSSGQEGDSE